MKVRSRFAPSNTGRITMGNMRSALYAYAYTRKNKGTFYVRVEDTDVARSTKESLIDILECLEWLGIKADHGPSLEDVKNDIYPAQYYQSKQTKIYDEFIEKVLKSGHAYEDQTGAIFLRMPQHDWSLSDMVIGYVSFKADSQKDFVIRRQNGMHTFHWANVVSDIIEEMNVLVKGADHLPNYPKHAAIFESLGYQIPRYAHLTLVLDKNGEKLSKRRDDQNAYISDLRKQGYTPEAIVNILGLLGWSNPDKKEMFDLDYICEKFDLLDCSKANPRYDQKKLISINSDKVRKMTLEQFRAASYGYGKEFYPDFMDNITSYQWGQLTQAYHSRSKTLSEMFRSGKFFINDKVEYQQDIIEKLEQKSFGILEDFMWFIEALDDWNETNLNDKINQFVTDSKVKIGDLGLPLRLSLSGSNITPPLHTTLAILGKEKSIQRMRDCLNYFCPKTEAKEVLI